MADCKTIEMACLGRPFQLGMLYDCRRDDLITGLTLWDSKILKDKISVQNQANTDFKIFATDSTEDKSHALRVNASLEASFLSGLVSVKGSAEFLNNKKKSMKQSRVTLQYRASTHFKQLTMDHLGTGNIKHQNVFEQGFATHVVTAVLYGAQAFFVFDREVSSSEDHLQIQQGLQTSLKKIPFTSVGCEASLDMTEEEKMEANKFSCTFHGDFSLPRNPVTFSDAIQVCADLPTMLGKDVENAVPMTVWLFPLVKLDLAAAKLVREISISLVKHCKSVFDEFNNFDMRCQDLMKTDVSMKFSEIENKLTKFRSLCSQHKLEFQKILCQLLPGIRGGGKEEEALNTALTSLEQSPFHKDHINAYLKSRDGEINLVESYLKKMEAVDVITSSSDLEKLILDFNNEYVVVFALSSLEQNEKYILNLEEFLNKTSSDEMIPYKPDPSSSSQQWFNSKEVKALARQTIQLFLDFYEANRDRENVKFCIASIPDTNMPGASVYVYQDGELLSSQFELPPKPCVPVIISVEHDCVHLEIKAALHDTNSTEPYCILYRKTQSSDWNEVVPDGNSTTVAIKQLKADTDYQLKWKTVKCHLGASLFSDVVSFKTLPYSLPGAPELRATELHSLSVTWKKSVSFVRNVKVHGYVLEYRENTKDKDNVCWISKDVLDNRYTVNGLEEGTDYAMRVSVKYSNGKSPQSAQSVLSTVTLLEELRSGSSRRSQDPFIHDLKYPTSLRKPKDMKYKVIMVIGADEMAKANVCNWMVNYIFGVKWEDNFRFRLKSDSAVSEALNTPNRIHSYEIRHRSYFQVPFSVTIVDIPGLYHADCSKSLLDTIKIPLPRSSRIDHVDAICYIFQSNPDHNCSSTYDFIKSLFPEDMAGNLIFLESGDQTKLEATQSTGITFPRSCFKFNTKPLFAPKTQKGHHQTITRAEDGHMQMEWNSNYEEMKEFFKVLEGIKSMDITSITESLHSVLTLLPGHD